MINCCLLHASVVHSSYDDRIFFRQAQTLAREYKKIYVVGFKNGIPNMNADYKNISIIQIRKQKIKKMCLEIYNLFFKICPSVIHIHDPYLIQVAYKYSLQKKVQIIYDIHENWPLLILTHSKQFVLKKYLHAFYVYFIEKYYLDKFSGLVVADDNLYKKYRKYENVIQIRNYAPSTLKMTSPHHRQTISKIIDFKQDHRLLIYVGRVDSSRALDVPMKAIARCNEEFNLKFKFLIIGPGDASYLKDLQALSKKHNHSTLILKPVLYNQIYEILSLADCGWAAIPDSINFKHRIPNKIFDYMQAGLVIIGSNLTFTKKLIKRHSIGYILNVIDVNNSVQALKKALNNKHSEQSKLKTKNLFEKKYNWNTQEAKKLIGFYSNIIK